jgi:cytoskeletal protein CcmA (bactofilin family)
MTEIRNDTMDEDDFDTILSSDIEFSGTLLFSKPFLIKGRVTGEIDAKGALVIAEGAVVDANVRAPSVIVRGSVHGNIVATNRVEIAATGSLMGDITAPEIFMEKGCVFNGSCSMDKGVRTESA